MLGSRSRETALRNQLGGPKTPCHDVIQPWASCGASPGASSSRLRVALERRSSNARACGVRAPPTATPPGPCRALVEIRGDSRPNRHGRARPLPPQAGGGADGAPGGHTRARRRWTAARETHGTRAGARGRQSQCATGGGACRARPSHRPPLDTSGDPQQPPATSRTTGARTRTRSAQRAPRCCRLPHQPPHRRVAHARPHRWPNRMTCERWGRGKGAHCGSSETALARETVSGRPPDGRIKSPTVDQRCSLSAR